MLAIFLKSRVADAHFFPFCMELAPSETRMHKFTDLLIKAGYDHSNHINEAIDSLSKQSNDVTIISSENEEIQTNK